MPMTDADARYFIDRAARELVDEAVASRDQRKESLYRTWRSHVSSIGVVMDRARALIKKAGRQNELKAFEGYLDKHMHDGNYTD